MLLPTEIEKQIIVMTTDIFDEWLDNVELENYDDIDSLYRTVNDLSDYGMFTITEANGVDNGWILKEDGGDIALHIKTEKARGTFLSIIESRFCEGMSEEGWYAFHKAMEKDD